MNEWTVDDYPVTHRMTIRQKKTQFEQIERKVRLFLKSFNFMTMYIP